MNVAPHYVVYSSKTHYRLLILRVLCPHAVSRDAPNSLHARHHGGCTRRAEGTDVSRFGARTTPPSQMRPYGTRYVPTFLVLIMVWREEYASIVFKVC